MNCNYCFKVLSRCTPKSKVAAFSTTKFPHSKSQHTKCGCHIIQVILQEYKLQLFLDNNFPHCEITEFAIRRAGI